MSLRWTMLLLALLVAACGGGSRPAATTIPRIEHQVKSVLERDLMTSQPRTEQGSSGAMHVRRVRCVTAGGRTFRCEVTFMNGSRRQVIARESSEGIVAVGEH